MDGEIAEQKKLVSQQKMSYLLKIRFTIKIGAHEIWKFLQKIFGLLLI